MKKEQIINSARKLFSKYGFKKVSMDEIAKEANVTKKTVYTYFESKEELLKYFIQEEILNMKKIVENIEKQKIDFFESVHQVIYNLLKYKHQEEFLKIIFEEMKSLNNKTLIENLKPIDIAIQNYITEKLQYAINKQYIEVENIEITSFLIYKMYLALMFEWTEQDKILNEKIIADNILKILKSGLGKKDVK